MKIEYKQTNVAFIVGCSIIKNNNEEMQGQ